MYELVHMPSETFQEQLLRAGEERPGLYSLAASLWVCHHGATGTQHGPARPQSVTQMTEGDQGSKVQLCLHVISHRLLLTKKPPLWPR